MVAAAAPPDVSPAPVAAVPVLACGEPEPAELLVGVELEVPAGAWLDGSLAPEDGGGVLEAGFVVGDVVGVGPVEPQF